MFSRFIYERLLKSPTNNMPNLADPDGPAHTTDSQPSTSNIQDSIINKNLSCDCDHKLGFQRFTKNRHNSKQNEQLTIQALNLCPATKNRHNSNQNEQLATQALNLIGPANSQETTSIPEKIKEIKVNLKKYAFGKDNKIMYIPNYIPLEIEKKKVGIVHDHLTGEKSRFLGRYIEDVAFQQIVNSMHSIETITEAFVMRGLDVNYLLNAKRNAAMEEIAETKNRNKGVDKKFPDLNQHEEELLKIFDLEGNDLVKKCIELHKERSRGEESNTADQTAKDIVDKECYNEIQ